MLIANPIYDTIFKFLMDDNESAKIILSTLINAEIEELTATNTLQTHIDKKLRKKGFVHFSHLDYTAQIIKADGTKENVHIELQKAYYASDFYRFRLYLTEKFKNSVSSVTKKKITTHTPIKFIPIFILNFEVETEVKDLVIQTSKNVKGVLKNKILENPVDFLDDLMYDITIVQIPYINKIDVDSIKNEPHKLELYKLFKLFDQSAKAPNDDYKLNIKDEVPKKYERLVIRLQNQFLNSSEIKNQLIEEDTRVLDVMNLINEGINYKKILEENKKNIKEKEKTIEESKKTIQEKEKTIEEKEKTIEEKEKTIEEKEKTIEEKEKTIEEKENALIKSIILLAELNLSSNDIALKLNIDLDFVKQVLKK